MNTQMEVGWYLIRQRGHQQRIMGRVEAIGLDHVSLWSMMASGTTGTFYVDDVEPIAKLPAPGSSETEREWIYRALKEGKVL